MPFGGLLTVGLIGAGGSLLGGLFGKSAANKASQQQSDSAQRALDFQRQIFAAQQGNMAPYQQAGTTSLAMLMDALKSGKFGVGSTGDIPKFTAPTLAEVQQTPGYQFTQQQGNKGILQAAAAAGGAISGGTLRAADAFNTNLANTTYGDAFQRAIQGYSANLQGYQTDLQRRAQEYRQLFDPAQLGENAVAGINNIGSGVAQNVGNLMTQQGNAQAAGTIGGTNALTSGITGASNNLIQSVLMGNLMSNGGQFGRLNPGGTGVRVGDTFTAGGVG